MFGVKSAKAWKSDPNVRGALTAIDGSIQLYFVIIGILAGTHGVFEEQMR